MIVSQTTFIIFSAISGVLSDIDISEDDYNLLPPIFHIDPYDKCIQEKKLFCRISLKLKPLNADDPSKIRHLIQETKKSKRHYNHDELYHAICLNRSYHNEFDISNNVPMLKMVVSKLYSDKYKSKGLEGTVVNINVKKYEYHLKTYDVVLLIFIISYLLLITLATLYNITLGQGTKRNKYFILFSVWYNFQKLVKAYHQKDFQKLKCIQAIRFYTTVLIIFCHTFCSFAGGYVADTKYLEDIPLNFVRHSIRNLFVFLVQTFFLISAWLLSYHTFKIFDQNKKIDIYNYAGLTFLNRYLRIIPPVLLMVSLASSIWIYGSFHGPIKYVYSDKEHQRCQRNWWITFLFLSNHYRQHDMCYFTTWYLSADTQLYALSLVFLLMIIKYRQIKHLILALCLILGIIIPSTISYLYNLDFIFRITPENSKNNMFLTFEFSATYSSTYANMATYMLGLIFGYLYFRLENKLLFSSNLSVAFWWISSVGLPLTVVIISSYEYSRIPSAVLAGILKPIYALGIGIAIFGMSQQTGGFLRKLCEWKPALFLGKFTYSTYVVHFGIVFSRTASATAPLQVSDYILFRSFLQDTLLSFICGFFVHLLLEMPAAELQHIFVPKFSIQHLKTDFKRKKVK